MKEVYKFIQDFVAKQWQNPEKRYLLSGSMAALSIQLLTMGLGFITISVLANLIGDDGYDKYTYTFAMMTFVSGILALGLDRLLVREIARYKTHKQWSYLKGLLHWSHVLVGSVCVVAAIALYFVFPLLPKYQYFTGIALLSIPFFGLLRIQQASLRGAKWVVHGQLPEMLIRPVLFLSCIGIVYLFNEDWLDSDRAIALNILFIGIALIISSLFFYQKLYVPVKKATATYEYEYWRKNTTRFFSLSLLTWINLKADVLILGYLLDLKGVGFYQTVVRLASFLKLSLMALNYVLAPLIADLYAKGNIKRLQQLTTQFARIVFLVTLIPAGMLLFFGKFFLQLIKPSFMVAYPALVILCLGQLFNVACGSVASLLAMTGYEKDVILGIACSMLINIALNFLLIPSLAIEGAAIAHALALTTWNGILLFFVFKRLGIDPTIFGFFRKQ